MNSYLSLRLVTIIIPPNDVNDYETSLAAYRWEEVGLFRHVVGWP